MDDAGVETAGTDGGRLANLEGRDATMHSLPTDTDGDGVSDEFERYLLRTDPTDPDTDGDGVSDGDEDADGDGLTNAEEERDGSDPTRADGDADGIPDPAELDDGTDPLAADSDDDGLTDAEEPRSPFEADPLDPDTDGDGTLDGRETYTTRVTDESVGVTVAVTGQGNVASGVTIAREQRAGFDWAGLEDAAASEILEVTSTEPFRTATLEIEYDGSEVANESDLAVFVYDESKQVFEPVPTSVDRANDIATARSDAVGVLAVLSRSKWAALFPAPDEQSEWGTVVTFEDFNTSKCTGECRVEDGNLIVGPASIDEEEPSASNGVGLLCTPTLDGVSCHDRTATGPATGPTTGPAMGPMAAGMEWG